MKILVCSRISIPAKDRTLPAWVHCRSLGHEVWVEHPDSIPSNDKPDAIISMGVTIMKETLKAHERWPTVPLFCYNWDCYEWVWTNPRPGEYDYKLYGELLSISTEIWVPSFCTGERTEQWWGLKNWHRILSACPWWDYPDTTDHGYALCCLREIPDPWWGKFEQACEECSIPYKTTRHECSYEEYQFALAHCSFLCAPLYELSTGGLSLMEGYYLGKPCLISDSKWNGARDYMQARAIYFRHGDWHNFKDKLMFMWDCRPCVPLDHREYIKTNFSDQRMVEDMLQRIERVR